MLNTIYCECTFPIWNYYFQLNDLKYKPTVLFGEESQRELCNRLNIEFYNRTDFINQDIKVEYTLSIKEIEFLNYIKGDELLYQMYKRFSVDSFPNEGVCNMLTEGYLKVWLSFIQRHKIDALILFEMPHIPYSYIGYKLFNYLNKKTFFSSTLPFKNKSFWFNRIENYSLFNNYKLVRTEEKYSEELQKAAFDSLNKLMPQSFKVKIKYAGYLAQTAICIRNILFPKRSRMRQYFKIIKQDQFVLLGNRSYYLRQLKMLFKKAIIKKYYIKLSSNVNRNDKNKRYLYALHFEPEMAVVPMAGEFYDQLSVIRFISKLLGPDEILYVKEHPWSFDYTKYQSIIRDRTFYDQIVNLKNVKLVSIEQNTNEMLEYVNGVFTLTGTVGWEAFLKLKKVVCFGNAWYNGLPNIYKVKSMDSITLTREFLNQDTISVDFCIVEKILKNKIYDVSVKMKCESEIDYFQNANVLRQAIESA